MTEGRAAAHALSIAACHMTDRCSLRCSCGWLATTTGPRRTVWALLHLRMRDERDRSKRRKVAAPAFASLREEIEGRPDR